jgi:cystathionine beta-lyase/cystathionine gamma-synthase
LNMKDYLDPHSCPEQKPAFSAMAQPTRTLHESIDKAIRRKGIPYLHPEDRTIQLDLLGSQRMTAWQEAKANLLFEGEGCWSSLPQIYARYGVEATRQLLQKIQGLENARAAVLTDCGMQACAQLFDVLLQPRGHAILMRQVYNKTRTYIEWLASRVGGAVSIVDDGDLSALEAAIQGNTTLIFAETYTNPLTRAVDPAALGELVARERGRKARALRLVVDNTIASPWSLKRPLLDYEGVDFVVASGTKSLSGQDRDLWGYVASNHTDALNELMDLQAMRGGILDWRRAEVIVGGLEQAKTNFERRCHSAAQVAAFLSRHPRAVEVHHPSLPNHPDREVIDRHYQLPGSLLSFRVRDASEEDAKHVADVLATCIVPRYALSFDGLTTKVNHHLTVSEYFTPVEELQRAGIDRLVRLGVGLEEPDDVIACLNWALWRYDKVSPDEVRRWQVERARELGIYGEGRGA